LAPKSTTTPVAIALSESVGGIASLTAAFTILTGILGAVAAPRLLFATLPWMLNLSP
jgi:putative effector of murein hydrolase